MLASPFESGRCAFLYYDKNDGAEGLFSYKTLKGL